MSYLLCTIISENYDVHSRNNYHSFKFRNAVTTAIKSNTQYNQVCCSTTLLGLCLTDVFHESVFAKTKDCYARVPSFIKCIFKSRTALHVFVSVYIRKSVG